MKKVEKAPAEKIPVPVPEKTEVKDKKLSNKNAADSDFDSELDKNIAKEEKIVDELPAPPELEPAENIKERDK